MTTEGSGIAWVDAAVPQALTVAAGAGVLIQEGMLLPGKIVRAHMAKKDRQYAARDAAKLASDRAHRQEFSGRLAMQIATIATASAAKQKDQQAQSVYEAMNLARQAISDAQQTARARANVEREQIASRLMLEIENGRGFLPARIIAQAEDALEDTKEEMLQEIARLQEAWRRVATVQATKERQRRETQRLLQISTTQLALIEDMLQGTSARTLYRTFTEQRRTIENLIKTAQAALDSNISDALQQAQQAHADVRSLTESVSTSLIDISDSIQSEINTFLGTLTTLNTMLEEAVSTKLIAIQEAQQLMRRIAHTTNEVQSRTEGPLSDSEQSLHVLRERVELLKQEVFSLVEQRQQRYVANSIATTLAELGFQSTKSNKPALKENGDVLRIEALRTGMTKNGERDDKVVSFDISRNGNIAYDFSGYVGDACLVEARRVFAALRNNGIYILDEQAMEYIQAQPAGTVTINTLKQPHLHPQLQANKLQAELAERLRSVLEDMQFGTITQNVVGGCIELEAFNGSIGYRVVLPTDGSTQVFKDVTYTDVSTDLDDPIVAEAYRLAEEEEEDSTLPKSKPVSAYQPRKQRLEN
jgi:hypothetical protein